MGKRSSASSKDPLLIPNWRSEPVGTDEMMIVIPPQHRWAQKEALTPEDLVSETWVLREDGSGTRAVVTDALASLGVDPRKLRINIALPSNEAVRAAVEAGIGTTALSSLVCADSLAAGKLVKAAVKLPSASFQCRPTYRALPVTGRRGSFEAHTFRQSRE